MKKILSYIRSGYLLSKLKEKFLEKPFAMTNTRIWKKQSKLLKRILNEAVNNCEYYKNLNKHKKDLKVSNFPILTKQEITENFDLFVSKKKNKYEYVDAYTGGSTGEPFHFLLNGIYEVPFGKKRWKEYGFRKGNKILAMDGHKIKEEDINNNIYWLKISDNDIPFGSYALSSLYLNDLNAKYYCQFIIDFQPDFLRGYPSFVYSISCYAEKLGISLLGIVKGIELTSETISDYQVLQIKKVFGSPVYFQYGHTESIVYAYTYDETYKYRVEPLYGYVEVLDSNGNHVKEGEIGEVIVTTLHNHVMPLIRYSTGDYAVYGGKDKRYMYLNKVAGRTQDYIIDSKGNKVLLTALIFGQHCKALGHIIKWQIVQKINGEIELYVIPGKNWSKVDEEEIYSQFKKLGRVETKFIYVDQIAPTPRGKSKMLIQYLKV